MYKNRRRSGRRVATLVTTTVGVTAAVVVQAGATPSAASDLYEKMARFDCLGVPQEFVVPKDVTSITALVSAASGGGCGSSPHGRLAARIPHPSG
jgi:hypothetical protein